MKNVIAVHLLNDRSGSPLVLRNALDFLLSAGYRVDLLTATPNEEPGFLSDLPGVITHALPYRWSPNRWRTLINFLWAQVAVFISVLRLATPSTVVYINSLLPGGAALAAKCRGARVVYHLHEVSIRPALLKRLLCRIVNLTADRALFVSRYVQETLGLTVRHQEVVYNALPLTFLTEAHHAPSPTKQPFVVLMACSLKDYKGVPEFFQLARTLPDMQFELVLNASAAQLDGYRATYSIPANLTLFPTTCNMHPFYQRAAVVVNLSRPAEWVETFGMTILEAMYYGRPVVVPPVGGVSEVNLIGQTGFAIDGRDLPALQQALLLLRNNPRAYARMSAACLQRAAAFSPARFGEQIRRHFQAEFAQVFVPTAQETGNPIGA